MTEWLNQALFGFYPYIALAVLAIGSVLRFDREQYTWRTGSSQLLRRKQLVLGSILFHVGILLIFVGHLVGLLTPMIVWETLGVTHAAKQMLAIIAGGVAGAMCLVGGLLLLHRRLLDPRIRATSTFGDTAILVLLMAQLCLGLAATQRWWGDGEVHDVGARYLHLPSWRRELRRGCALDF